MTEHRKIKAVLFDFDGTIVDTNPLIVKSWQHMAMKFLGHELDMDEILSSFGIPLETCMEMTAKKHNMHFTPKDMSEIYREYQNNHGYEDVIVYEGMKETLTALHEKGVKTGIVTSRINSSTRDMLSYFGIAELFDVIIGADDTNIHKPNPYPALLCCERLGVKPQEAIMVGDSVYDIQCGMNAGAKGCFVKWSVCTSEEKAIKEAHPDFIISSPQELIYLI